MHLMKNEVAMMNQVKMREIMIMSQIKIKRVGVKINQSNMRQRQLMKKKQMMKKK